MNKVFVRLKSGLNEIREHKWKIVIPIIFIVICAGAYMSVIEFIKLNVGGIVIENLLLSTILCITITILVFGLFLVIVLLGIPISSHEYDKIMIDIGR